MPKLEDLAGPTADLPAIANEAGWENEGGAMCPGPNAPAALHATFEQPRLYADLLTEADRRRRVADGVIIRSMIAPRGH